MSVNAVVPAPGTPFVKRVEGLSGQKVLKCIQCGKCSAGCPAAFAMDFTPRQVMRALQLGLPPDELLGASTIWVCLFCQTCSVRCPMEIDIAGVMEALRLVAIEDKHSAAQKNIALFHRLFLGGIARTGRLHEFGLGGMFNLRSRQPFLNVPHLPKMLFSRRLPVLPPWPWSKGAGEVRRIFRRVQAREAAARGAK